MTKLPGRRPAIARLYVLLLTAGVVWSLGWPLPPGEDASYPSTTGSRMLAPGLENGVTRAAPPIARAQEMDRSLKVLIHPPSALVPLTALALGLIVAAVTVVMRSASGGQLASVVGSRGPPSSLFGPTLRPA